MLSILLLVDSKGFTERSDGLFDEGNSEFHDNLGALDISESNERQPQLGVRDLSMSEAENGEIVDADGSDHVMSGNKRR